MKQIKTYETLHGYVKMFQNDNHFLVHYHTDDLGYIEEYRYKEDAVVHFQFCRYTLDKLTEI